MEAFAARLSDHARAALDAGGRVWVHCHGRMGPVLRRFVDLGVDVLNPIEPSLTGGVTLEEAFAAAGDAMALEGNIETHDFMVAGTDKMLRKVHAGLDAGRGRRHILCPISGYMEKVEPSPQEIANWLLYIDEGVRYAESLAT
ncbi:MAG: uroporphyrinogen decarboxylase family protein [Gemmatimonadota bacterium]